MNKILIVCLQLILAIGAIQQRIAGSLKQTDPQIPQSAWFALSFLNQHDINRSFEIDFGQCAYRGNSTKNWGISILADPQMPQ